MEFQSTEGYDLMAVKTNEPNWKENVGIQNIGNEDSHGLQ